MKAIYNIEEWQSASGFWYCNVTKHLATTASAWWFPSRVWGMNLSEFATMLKDKYNAQLKILDNDMLLYYWNKEDKSKCHKFVLDTNAQARKRKIMI